jgi:23S rRNA pseudouridine2605 synthase
LAVERLHKIMAARGAGSRRKCEELIAAGRVTVDGSVVTELGTKVSSDAEIRLDGRVLKEARRVYCVLNKPRGVVTTLSDEKGRTCVGDFVKRLPERVYPVGRLDEDSDGLLFLTNDGRMAEILTHPRFGVEKTYRVKVRGRLGGAAVTRLREGIHLREGTAAAKVRVLKATRNASMMLMTIDRGYNRQIRRMCSAVGHPVMRLTRVAFGPLRLKGLARGDLRRLSADELRQLEELAEGSEKRLRQKDRKRRGREDAGDGKNRRRRRR